MDRSLSPPALFYDAPLTGGLAPLTLARARSPPCSPCSLSGGPLRPRPAHAGMASRLTVGIAEQQPDFFSQPLFERTEIHHAPPARRLERDVHQVAARAGRPLADRRQGRRRDAARQLRPLALQPPRPALGPALHARLRAFHERYPWVTTFATWNEANHCGEPTCKHPEKVAAYWRAIRIECPSCRVLAAELLDSPNMAAWARAFRRASKVEPKLWGLHNYIDANRFTTGYTKSMLAATRGEVWLTETGGIVARNNNSRVRLPASTAHAAKATRYVFEKLVRVDSRIKRVYLYHWNDQPGPRTWDLRARRLQRSGAAGLRRPARSPAATADLRSPGAVGARAGTRPGAGGG